MRGKVFLASVLIALTALAVSPGLAQANHDPVRIDINVDPHPAYTPPAPPAPMIFYTPAPPSRTCYTQPGYWSQQVQNSGIGFVTYQNVWVPARTVCQ